MLFLPKKAFCNSLVIWLFKLTDYADVSAIMKNGNMAVIGIGENDSQDRVNEAVRQALTHPLLDVDYQGATGALIHVTCGPDLKLEEDEKIPKELLDQLRITQKDMYESRPSNIYGFGLGFAMVYLF